MQRLNTCTRCILRTYSTLLSICKAKIKSRIGINDPTDKGTKRPNAAPLTKKGKAFNPMILPDFDCEITLPDDVSPDDPISLFDMYYTRNY